MQQAIKAPPFRRDSAKKGIELPFHPHVQWHKYDALTCRREGSNGFAFS